MPSRPTSFEQQLSDYWSKRVEHSMFAVLLDRDSALERLKEAKNLIGELIFKGRPLRFDEYHLAIAHSCLLTEMPYLEFFKKRWHETDGHFSYGPASTCEMCTRERKEKKWKAKRLTA